MVMFIDYNVIVSDNADLLTNQFYNNCFYFCQDHPLYYTVFEKHF